MTTSSPHKSMSCHHPWLPACSQLPKRPGSSYTYSLGAPAAHLPSCAPMGGGSGGGGEAPLGAAPSEQSMP